MLPVDWGHLQIRCVDTDAVCTKDIMLSVALLSVRPAPLLYVVIGVKSRAKIVIYPIRRGYSHEIYALYQVL